MTKKFKVVDYDIIYLSYDEPNAEKNYADLLQKVPWAKRVHGVHGSDAAHKACAKLSDTDRFITVDGDNIVDENFLTQEIDFEEHADLENSVISWTAINHINGLRYGNGGLKCWPKEYVLNMRTHENADSDNPHAQVDFCWDLEYIQMNSCFSRIMNNHTPQQAWRAGFREGVKMALDRGVRPTKEELLANHWKNMHRLYIWMMVGADIQNGLWAIYGAREGLYKTMCTDWDYVNVRDFKWLNEYWNSTVQININDDNILEGIAKLGDRLFSDLQVPVAKEPLGKDQSIFFKTVYQNPSRNSNHLLIDKEEGANK